MLGGVVGGFRKSKEAGRELDAAKKKDTYIFKGIKIGPRQESLSGPIFIA